MIGRIRRRLTLGYVGVFALILTVLGVAVTALFWKQASAQQDDLLEGRANSTLGYVSAILLDPDPTGPGTEDPTGRRTRIGALPSAPSGRPRTKTSASSPCRPATGVRF